MPSFNLSNLLHHLNQKNHLKFSQISAMKLHCCTLPKFKNVTYVIFDLDGTILDTEVVNEEAIK